MDTDEVRRLARLLRINKQGPGFAGGAAWRPEAGSPWGYRRALFRPGQLPAGWIAGSPPPMDPEEWSRRAKESAAEREAEWRQQEAERERERVEWQAKEEAPREELPPEPDPEPWDPPGPQLLR